MKTSMLTQHLRVTQLTTAMLPCPESPVETELGPGLHRKCAQLCSSSRVKVSEKANPSQGFRGPG